MNRQEVRRIVAENARLAGLSDADIRVQVAGERWAITVIASGFDNLTLEERRRTVTRGLGDLALGGVEVLSPAEAEWSGRLLQDADLDYLPLWPDALERASRGGSQVSPRTFASSLDEDVDPPVFATFYSLRGGVGRSTALSYAARILASRGKKVVCVDMDLEAPGLAALLGCSEAVRDDMGLVNILVAIDRGESPDLSKHLVRVNDSDDLYCMPAGTPSAKYAHMLQFIDPSAWYKEETNPLRELMSKLKTDLPFRPDAILLDARTGLSPSSAPLLFDFSDIAIIVFFPHPQARKGTEVLVRALLGSTSWRTAGDRALTPEPRFVVSPVPTSKVVEIGRRYENRAIEWIGEWLDLSGTEDINDITHFVPYRETIATSDQILKDRDVWRDFEPVAEWIAGLLGGPSDAREATSLATDKRRILSQLHFSSGTAEHQGDLLETFVETEFVRKALGIAVPLILGRKGTGKTAIFRRLAEGDEPVVVVSSPAPLRGKRSWLLGADGFRRVSEILERSNSDWRQFWTLYSSIATYLDWPFSSSRPEPPPGTALKRVSRKTKELAVVEMVAAFLRTKDAGLQAADWLSRLDEMAGSEVTLLFDGLDTGFGSSNEDRGRRRQALEGLFSFVTDRADGLENLRVKILLREDIWRQLRFENKSHFFGRSVTLKWSDQASFFRVVIKHALRAESFADHLRNAIVFNLQADVEVWSERDIFAAWNVLVGERMKGGNTTFTRNWVWNRLGDANEDHSPRYVMQLMQQALAWEQKEHGRSVYDRSIIRPRGLIEVLPEVSEEALGALRNEEFPELLPLLETLTRIGQTPIAASELSVVPSDLIDLGKEVGVLGVYEAVEERVERYKVPELFRWALKMTRRGQK